MEFFSYLSREWTVVSGAPLIFMSGWAIVAALCFAAMKLFDSGRKAALEERLRLKDDQLNDYKEKLAGASPEEARQRIAALEQRLDSLEPRALTEQQIRDMHEILSRVSGHVLIAQDMLSAEATTLQGQLDAIFRRARWEVGNAMVAGVGNPPSSGIAVTTRTGASLTPAAQAVVDAFDKIGLKYDFRREAVAPEDIASRGEVEILLTKQAVAI